MAQRMRATVFATGTGMVCAILASCERNAPLDKGKHALASAGWLQSTPTNTERFALIEGQLRGFDNAMWEVGERYRSPYDALMRENYDLAVYHWDKIKTAIDDGTQRRPARKPNADVLFLEYWQEIRGGFAAGDPGRAWNAFDEATTACKSCHDAEKLPHMNDQPVFDLKRPDGSGTP